MRAVETVRRISFWSAVFVFLVALILYTCTLAPTVTLVDSGELIVAAHSLGVAHPPGFPLYVILAHLASLLPWGNVAVRVNFVSAFLAALAAGMLALAVAELMMSLPERRETGRSRKKKCGKRAADAILPEIETWKLRLLVSVPAIIAGLLLATSRTLWSYATIAEVYTLNTFLICSVLYLMLRWRSRSGADDRSLLVAAIIFGLALGVHHVTVALILPALALLVYRSASFSFFASKRLLIAAAVSFAALVLVYSYLPLAAARDPILNWGNPRSLQAIWWHITGRQYQAFFEFSPAMIGQQLIGFCTLALRQFGRWWVPLALGFAVAGLIFLFKRDRTAFWFFVVLIAANLAYTLCYNIAEDKDAYYLPSFLTLALLVAFGLRWMIESLFAREWPTRNATALAIAVTLTLPAIALAANWPFNNRRHYFIAQDYVENIEREIEPNGLLMTFDWQVASPMLYTHESEGRRRDLKVVDVNLLRRSWYFDYLRRAYPEMMARSGEEVDRYLADLRAWEQDPERFKEDARLAQQIETSFHESLRSLVRRELTVGPAYVTYDVLFLTQGSDHTFTDRVLQNWQVVPRGLVFQLETERSFHDPGDVHLQTRGGLTDGSLRFEKDDVVRLKVIPAYAQTALHRGRYLALFGQHERAIASFQQALTFDPTLRAAREGWAQSITKLPKSQRQ